MKRVVIVADLHCGHVQGLTPPNWDHALDHPAYPIRREQWDFYAETAEALKPIDILVVNGDAIDGSGYRSGGTELFTTDRLAQATMATQALRIWDAPTIRMTYGTPYHGGQEEDFESVVARGLGGTISDFIVLDVNGVVLDIRHKVGTSQVFTSRTNAVIKEVLWNILKHAKQDYPKADVIVRSHAHYLVYAGDADWLGIVTPALQGAGSKFGARQMSGTTDFGLVSFDIESPEEWTWNYHILCAEHARVVAEEL